MVFRKNLRSLERRWEKISKFLGDLPSEQIFYRNIPLGAPAFSVTENIILISVDVRQNRRKKSCVFKFIRISVDGACHKITVFIDNSGRRIELVDFLTSISLIFDMSWIS